jgi:hypothetical protein
MLSSIQSRLSTRPTTASGGCVVFLRLAALCRVLVEVGTRPR